MNTVNPSRENFPGRSNRPDIVVMLLLLASLCLNVYLGWKVKEGSSSVEQNTKLSPGTKVDPITALSTDGQRVTISYDGTPKATVFFVISPDCVWCKRNQPNIEKLADAKANDFRFIALSLVESGLKEYIEQYHLKFPVYSGLTTQTVESLGLGATPQTIVISSEGKVLKVWRGAFTEITQPEVEAFFGIQLPGLTSFGN